MLASLLQMLCAYSVGCTATKNKVASICCAAIKK
jgi:hypothetical protein